MVLALVGASVAVAQTTDTANDNGTANDNAGTVAATPPPPPPAPYTPPPQPASFWQADISAVHAFRWHTTGIVGDVGGFFDGNFVGGEISYYSGHEHGYSWYNSSGAYNGSVPYREHLTTVNLAYRYSFRLPYPGMNTSGVSPLEAFVGGSAGIGWLEYYPGNPYFGGNLFGGGPGYSDDNKGRFDFNLVAGVQWNFTPNVGVKVAYRYIDVEGAHRFYTPRTRIDSGAIDAGLAFRF